MWNVLQLIAGLLAIAAMIAVQLAVFYLIYWLVMLVVGRLPIVGRRHRHDDWNRLNRRDG